MAPDQPGAALTDPPPSWSQAPSWCVTRYDVHPAHDAPLPDGSHRRCPGTGHTRPHVCHYVDSDGTTAGTCHLDPPHGGRCPYPSCEVEIGNGATVHATADECVHQSMDVTDELCAVPDCVVHGDTCVPECTEDTSHLLADGTWVDGRDRFTVSLDDVNVRRDETGAAVVDLAFDDDHATDVPTRLVLDVDAVYPVTVVGDLGAEFTRGEALALGLALLRLVRELDEPAHDPTRRHRDRT